MYDETYPVPPGMPVDPWTRVPPPAPQCACAAGADDAVLLALILAVMAARPHLRCALLASLGQG